MTITFHRVPHPAYSDHPITKRPGHGMDDLGQRTVKGVVWHRMIGTLRGTDTYFSFPTTDALTDYGVGTAGTDGARDDGVIIRWNDPLGRQSGWASGPLNAPYGDGLAFYNKYGINAINRDETSIEISGLHYDDPISQSCKQSVAAITAYWADQYSIPWDKFPISPQDGFSFVRWHQEFTIGTGKVCPGKVVMDATDEIIEMTRAILKEHQENAEPAPPPPSEWPSPVGIPHLDKDPVLVKGIWWFPITVQVEAIKRAVPRTYASSKAKQTGPTIDVREKRIAIAYVQNEEKQAWLILEDHTRVTAASFTPAVSLRVR